MTPTLIGRWQTRLLLLATAGVLVTLPFSLGLIGPLSSPIYFLVLMYVAVFGLAWDILYNYLQKFSWDRDWPGVYQLLAGIWEAIFIALLKVMQAPLPGMTQLDIRVFVLHYSLVWLAVYISSQSLMRILFPHWRFRGGQWL